MEFIQIRHTKAKFLALIDAAEPGPTIVARHGRPPRSSRPIEDPQRLYVEGRSAFVDLSRCVAFERDQTPRREVDL